MGVWPQPPGSQAQVKAQLKKYHCPTEAKWELLGPRQHKRRPLATQGAKEKGSSTLSTEYIHTPAVQLGASRAGAARKISEAAIYPSVLELELELIQSHMAQKPMLRGEVGARALRVRSDVRGHGQVRLCKALRSSQRPVFLSLRY